MHAGNAVADRSIDLTFFSALTLEKPRPSNLLERRFITPVIDRLFASMPEVVKALASPLANVDKITIVSTGNGDASGMNKITGDITKMAAQVPALFETLSGMPLSELLGKVRQIGDKSPKTPESPKA